MENDMIERYLGAEMASDIFSASMITGLITEKQASEVAEAFEKDAGAGMDSLKAALGIAKLPVDAASAIMNLVPKLVVTGLGVGGVAGGAYNILKGIAEKTDPKENMNLKIESMYRNKKRELDDARWMSEAREMRDDLRRNQKKMSNDEYAMKYNALVSKLKERKLA